MNHPDSSPRLISLIVAGAFSFAASLADTSADSLFAHWRFEQVQHLNGETTASVVGEYLTAEKGKASEPRPYVSDDSGKNNCLQSRNDRPSPNVFSDNVPAPQVDGRPNTRSLVLKRSEYVVPFMRPLPFYDMRKSWEIDASLMTHQLGTEQVFLCKEGQKGQMAGDVSIGFDNTLQQYFVEVTCADGVARRVAAGEKVEPDKWYDVRAKADFDAGNDRTTLQIVVKLSAAKNFGKPGSITFSGPAMRRDAGMWIVGRGFPTGAANSLQVLDGGIDEVKISGDGLPRVAGQNPLFTDAHTADPAALVVGDTVYAYVGRDAASPGGWFSMPEWLCYSSKDMKHWTAHGPVLAAKDFANANPGSAWAAQMVEKEGKFYFYVTLDRKEGHFITVAVGDSPTGPFKEARPGKPLITDDMTKDSHRANSDIDPTVFIDDDGTPWMAWGNGDCYMVKLNRNMVELDGPITRTPMRNYAEGPWIFKRNGIYYNVYAADAPGVQPEQICYATAPKITGPWSYRGYVTGHASHGFTIHPAVIEFKNQWYFFYHDGSSSLDGGPGGDARRSVCLEYLYFNPDGTIRPITQTPEGVSVSPSK
jgi:hypothetical protein